MIEDDEKNGADTDDAAEEFSDAMEETLHLLSSPANAERLRASIHQLESGRGTERELIEP